MLNKVNLSTKRVIILTISLCQSQMLFLAPNQMLLAAKLNLTQNNKEVEVKLGRL